MTFATTTGYPHEGDPFDADGTLPPTHTHECRDCRAEIPGGVQCEGGDAESECGWPGGNEGCRCSCLDSHGDPDAAGCSGAVEYRMALSGTGRSFPRCDKHWADRLDVQDGINRRYPDSPIPPSDFDPAYAGERWNDDY